MFDQEDSELNVVMGVVFGIIALVTGVRHFTPVFAPFRKVPSALARV